MFTGLIECVGTLVNKRQSGESIRLYVAAALPLEDVAVGDSIAVNGACLTVTAFKDGIFGFDVSPETVARSTFNLMRPGTSLNIERALKLGGASGRASGDRPYRLRWPPGKPDIQGQRPNPYLQSAF